MPSEISNFSHVVETIYRAATDPSRWQEAALACQHFVGGNGVTLQSLDTSAGKHQIIYCSSMDEAAVERYAREVLHRDEFVEFYSARGLMNVVQLTQDDFGPRDLIGHYFYEECYKNLDTARLATISLLSAKSVVAYMSVHRSMDDALFTPEDKRRYEMLVPHLQNALRISVSLAEAEASAGFSEESIERNRSPVLLLDNRGRVHARNMAAALAESRGFFRYEGGLLRLGDPEGQKRLTNILQSIRGFAAGDTVAPNPAIRLAHRGTTGLLILCPIYPREFQKFSGFVGVRWAAFLLYDLPGIDIPGGWLRELYGLTPAETQVAQLLANGHGTGDIGKRLCIGADTVRFHLKNIYQKTGSAGQVELVARLAGTFSISS